MTHLSVNLNKVCLVRNARGADHPKIEDVARLCIDAGCRGLTLHPRVDERHATIDDVYRLARMQEVSSGRIEFNIEGDAREGLLEVVREVKPTQFTLVPAKREELTTERGWRRDEDGEEDIDKAIDGVPSRTRISLFVDARSEEVELAADKGLAAVEFHTFFYAQSFGTSENEEVLKGIQKAASLARRRGLRVHAGHDLNLANLPKLIAGIRPDEVSIGQALVTDAILMGMPLSTEAYCQAISKGQP
ncbi:MAG TPA: pyridoxine 5'-phosphate synthase [Acidobacteriota bacterium]|nr:pyridoxine 5'-phosphate synthase [Acidobacteriota bacterium]